MPLILKSILTFGMKHWKLILTAVVVGGIVFTIYTQKLEISELTSDLITTQQELDEVQDAYATQQELNRIREDIASANQAVMNRVNEQNRRVSTSLNDIESRVRENGTEVEQIKMQLHPDVIDLIDQEIEDRGYND